MWTKSKAKVTNKAGISFKINKKDCAASSIPVLKRERGFGTIVRSQGLETRVFPLGNARLGFPNPRGRVVQLDLVLLRRIQAQDDPS
jgi:hypothetical protein